MSNSSIDKLIHKDWFKGIRICFWICLISRIWKRGGPINSSDLLLELDRRRRRSTSRVNYFTIQMMRASLWASNNLRETRIQQGRVTVERVWTMAVITPWARKATGQSELPAIFKMNSQTPINWLRVLLTDDYSTKPYNPPKYRTKFTLRLRAIR